MMSTLVVFNELKSFLYFWKWNFLASYFSYISRENFPSSRTKNNPPHKISYTPRQWNFLTLILKKFLYFFKRKLFLYFRNRNFFIFRKMETSKKILYISGNGTFLYFLKKFFSYVSRKVYSEPWHIWS